MLADQNLYIQILAVFGILAGCVIFLIGLIWFVISIAKLSDERQKRKRDGKWHQKFAITPTVVHIAEDGKRQVIWFRRYEERFIEEKTKYPTGDSVLIFTTYARRLAGGQETEMSNIVAENLYD